MDQIVTSRWFKLAELILVLICGIAWYLYPGLKAWPLLVVFFPWALRLSAGRFPFQRTKLDLALLLFLATASIGLWASYDPVAAQAKFWILVSAVLVYYAFAGQPVENLWFSAGLLSLVGVLIAGSFLFEYDWREGLADLGVINRMGVWWMAVRPSLSTPAFHPNRAGGLLAMLFPFPVAIGLRAWRRRWIDRTSTNLRFSAEALFVVLVLGVIGAALLLSSSRGAWFALLAGLGIWLLWGLSGQLARSVSLPKVRQPRLTIFVLGSLIIGAGLIFFLVTYPGGLIKLTNELPGASSGDSRLALDENTAQLVGDFPFTGGGLAAFPGLYSQYMLVLPVFLFGYSHNFFLDVALEQGLPGFFILILLLVVTVWMLGSMALRSRREFSLDLLVWATLASLVTALLHGFVDDALYGNLGTPLLLVLPGLAVAFDRAFSLKEVKPVGQQGINWRGRPWAYGLLIALALFGFSLLAGKSLAASWYANLGAVQMAKIELADFPSGKWADGSLADELEVISPLFEQALLYDQGNRTAHHRLGLIAMQRGQFPQAVAHLEVAHQSSPGHRGIRKQLGYSYAWAGRYENARGILAGISEAAREMRIYVGWWGGLGQEDLAEKAQEMASILARNSGEATDIR